MSAPATGGRRAISERFGRMLVRARQVARTPHLRTTDDLIEAADILARHGDLADRRLALEARTSALFGDEYRRTAAGVYLHRRRVRALIRACWISALIVSVAVALLIATHLFHH